MKKKTSIPPKYLFRATMLKSHKATWPTKQASSWTNFFSAINTNKETVSRMHRQMRARLHFALHLSWLEVNHERKVSAAAHEIKLLRIKISVCKFRTTTTVHMLRLMSESDDGEVRENIFSSSRDEVRKTNPNRSDCCMSLRFGFPPVFIIYLYYYILLYKYDKTWKLIWC